MLRQRNFALSSKAPSDSPGRGDSLSERSLASSSVGIEARTSSESKATTQQWISPIICIDVGRAMVETMTRDGNCEGVVEKSEGGKRFGENADLGPDRLTSLAEHFDSSCRELINTAKVKMDPQLVLFRRQYLQLFEPDFLAWPPKQLLRDADVQAWLYANLFNSDRNSRLPPERYQLRVLKPLVKKIEQSIQDPEEDEISDDLMSHLSALITSELPSEAQAVQQKSYVTFTCLAPTQSFDLSPSDEPTITLLERPHLISGSLTTGFRTWEAALHLGSYLLTPAGRELVQGKNVLELGAGTGFVSVLAAKHLGAKHVTVTDGDEGVVDALKENFFLNGLDDEERMVTSVLRWGRGLTGTWVEEDCEAAPYDLVVGADITYDKQAISALVGTLRLLFELRPSVHVLIAGTVRNADTFGTFTHQCEKNKFQVIEIDFQPKPIREQTAMFYAKAVPFKLLSIRAPPT